MRQEFLLKKMVFYCRMVLDNLQKNPAVAGEFLSGEIQTQEAAQACFDCIQRALEAGLNGQPEAVCEAIDESLAFAPHPAPRVLLLWIQALGLTGQRGKSVALCWDTAQWAESLGDSNLCLDACMNLLVQDLADEMVWINSPERLQQVAAMYERQVASLTLPAARIERPGDKVRIGMIVPLLHSERPPFVRRALHFSRYLDRDRYELRIYSTEALSMRRMSCFPNYFSGSGSLPSGQAIVDEMEANGAPVWISPTEQLALPAAVSLSQKIAEDRVDVLIVQSGLTMPLDWLTTRIAPVPVKLHIHIGVSNYLPGLDYTLFDNSANLEREAVQWPAGTGVPALLRRGTDIVALDAVPRGDRADVGVPDDAVVIGSLSGNFATRFSDEYARVLIDVLQRCPDVWLMPVGSAELPPRVRTLFEEAGVAERVRHIPETDSPARELRMMDIYASEFPHGGSQAVVEALVCGLPVVAMRCGDTHYESISADIAGPGAILGNRPDAYRDRLIELVQNPEQRARESKASRRRAETHFSIRSYVNRVARLGETILARKCGDEVNEQQLLKQWQDGVCVE